MHAEALASEMQALVSARQAEGWDSHWRDCMKFALPSDLNYDNMLASGGISSVTNTAKNRYGTGPQGARVTKSVYDQTSLWAIERLAAGLISLKTPETGTWHTLTADDPFGYEPSSEEEVFFDRLVRFLFKVRSNPKTGFWPAHKAAVRSTCALGDGVYFIEEQFGDNRAPWRYIYVPLGECYGSLDANGEIRRFFRLTTMTAEAIAHKWPDKASRKIRDCADDPKRRQYPFSIFHAVVPRSDKERHGRMGTMGAPLAGYYVELDSKIILQETGYYELPYVKHSWGGTNARFFSEGPLALALAEIKSLNEMAKNELISAQQAVRPPLATFGDNFTRVNLNAGAVNPNLINGDGRLLAQPIMTHTRPDFAQQVLEQRRNMVREMLYLNLWQVLIESREMTATEAMLRAQEKGDLLGPVGISFNHSLSAMITRELGIMGRKGAFEPGSPLEAPESLMDREAAPQFTSDLDRMRTMNEVVGAQRTVAAMMEIAPLRPEIMQRLNVDKMSDLLRRGHGAPAELFYADEDVETRQASDEQLQQLAQTIELMKAGGEAAGAMGGGISAMRDAAA